MSFLTYGLGPSISSGESGFASDLFEIQLNQNIMISKIEQENFIVSLTIK